MTATDISTAPMALGQRIRLARTGNGLSQKALATAIGKSEKTVGNYENDRTSPDTTDLAAIAGATGKTLAWLLDEDSAPADVSSGTSMLDITAGLDSPDRVRRPTGPDGLTRAASSFVAEGHDADGLMYAVELTVYLRTSPRVTRHHHGVAEAPTSSAE